VRIVHLTSQSLQEGDNVGFFPEGTTTDGTFLEPFKSSLVQAAIATGATIFPVAIHYPHSNGTANTLMAYVGDMTLVESILNILKQKKPIVELHFLTPIKTEQATRQTVTKTAFNAIAKQLNF
jgi:1-acyl-sn-glycerol-3-phosphate acyltransferase